jgi:pilus assembly protein CpaC
VDVRFTALLVALSLAAPGLPAAAQGSGQGSGANGKPSLARIEELELAVGEQKVLPTDNVRSYSEAKKGIVDVRLTQDGSQFIVVALASGTTTVLLLMTDGSERHYRITVVDPDAPKRRGGLNDRVEARDNIRLDFYFVQLNKSYGHQLGIGWPGSVAPTFAATYDVAAKQLDSATAVIADQALPRLDMAQVSGWAKVMRQAAVVTANGDKASFAGGGEVNVAVQSALTTGIEKIEFGSIVEVEPRYDAKTGRVELKLHADVSELEDDRGTGVPGRATSRLDTIVNLQIGQSLILAGLTAKSERSSRRGLPFLSQIPLLGIFFGSDGKAREETENVVLIVPSVVDSVSMQARQHLSDALERYDEYSGDLDGIHFVPKTPSPASDKKGKP